MVTAWREGMVLEETGMAPLLLEHNYFQAGFPCLPLQVSHHLIFFVFIQPIHSRMNLLWKDSVNRGFKGH